MFNFCQFVPKTPMKVGELWATIGRAANLPNGSMRDFHVAGITDEENKAGQQGRTDERLRTVDITVGVTSIWGGGYGIWQATAFLKMSPHYRRKIGNPTAEKGSTTRSQQLFFSRSRMGYRRAYAHARDVAVAQRLHSATLGVDENW